DLFFTPVNIQISIQKMKISSTSKTCNMSDRSELGSDCIQLLSILDLKASFMFVISKFQYQMVK
ncbi:MAG: hypothetical protein OEM90_04045, partial [Desulfobacteraceae bacterium]|nr:hypothetical protein [Desulfobacteraceae bacterium]